jgi:hypothetical protein
MHGDWLVAIATLFAAIIGIFGGYLLSKYQREKRILRFVVMDEEDLAAALSLDYRPGETARDVRTPRQFESPILRSAVRRKFSWLTSACSSP